MFRNTLMRCTVALLCSTAPLMSNAAMTRIATNGAWSAYAGESDDGQKLCTVSAEGGGRWMGMKYFAGDNKLIVHLMNTRWSARSGITVPVAAEFDSRGAWTASAQTFRSRDGRVVVEFSVPKRQIEQWVEEFKVSNKLYIRFPQNDDVTDWSVSLDGSDQILMPFVMCMAATAI